MPMPGDQHRDTAATTNPFADPKPHITEYTAQEIATLQSRLDKQLGPEYISTRPGAGGGKLHYLAADKAINLANEVFGFNGWSSAIQNVQIDFVDDNTQTGKVSLGLSTIVRVTLRDGTYHEDIGYGHIENCKGKAAAFEKAKKEAATDAMKRALRTFGNVLGNCLYDKDYLQKIAKVKVAPTKWDAGNLHRHPDYAPVQQEPVPNAAQAQNVSKDTPAQRQASIQSAGSFGSIELEDDFGGNLFDETDILHPDDMRLDDSVVSVNTPAKRAMPAAEIERQSRQSVSRVQSMPQIRPMNVQPPPPVQHPQPLQKPPGPQRPPGHLAQMPPVKQLQPQVGNNQQRPGVMTTAHAANHSDTHVPKPNQATATDSSTSHVYQNRQVDGTVPNQSNGEQANEQSLPPISQPPPGIPEGFVSGRSVDLLNQPPETRPANSVVAFNPHAETPSIRRTQGMNPGKSAPVLRQAVTGAAGGTSVQANFAHQQPHGQVNGANGVSAPVRANFVNPSADQNRRVGMPPSAPPHSMQNRGAYKAPTPIKRPPLSDVSNMQQVDGTGDAKRPKLEQAEVPVSAAQEAAVTAAPAP